MAPSARFRRLIPLALSLPAWTACGPVLETDLQKAVKSNDAAAVERLLAAGAPLGSSWSELLPPGKLAIVHLSSGAPESVRILRLLVAAEPDRSAFLQQTFSVNCRRTPCYAPATVEHVARQRSVEALQVLIDAGLDPRSQGVTNALVHAIAEDDEPMARFLIEAGADVNGWSQPGSNRFGEVSVFEAARRSENAELIEYLQGKGAR